MIRILTLCTGNAARSVMLGEMLAVLSEAAGAGWQIRTAGTHAVEGQAISPRTLAAIEGIDELADGHYTQHRSHQLTNDDLSWADVVLCAEADHVAYVRARHPEAATRTVTLGSFLRYAPLEEPFAHQVAEVAARDLDDTLDVVDPAGGDQDDYDRCATTLWEMAQAFAVVATPVEP